MSYFYLVTIKNNFFGYTSRQAIHKTYMETLCKGRKMEWSSIISYELDKLSRWHMHTYVRTERPVYLKKFIKKGWTIHFQIVTDENSIPNVINYITKYSQNKYYLEQLDIRSFSTYNFMFS